MTRDVYTSDIAVGKKHNAVPRGMRGKRQRTTTFEWLNGPYNSVLGETSLWRAVITQAMMDALSRAGNAEAAHHKHEAINWLTGNGRDFVMVCLFAGLDPDYVRRKAKRALIAPMPWRAAPGKGKRYLERREYRKKTKQKLKCDPVSAPHGSAEPCIIAGPWAISA